jgi:hypothetical protein
MECIIEACASAPSLVSHRITFIDAIMHKRSAALEIKHR